MAFGGFKSGQVGQPMAEINMIPLIDVLLVLLVIFIISAPLLTHAVKVNLPKAASVSASTKPDDVQLSIDARGQVWWNNEPVDRTAMRARMAGAAATVELPAELPEVIDTGTRTEKPLLKSPVRTEVVDRKEIERSHARDLQEALEDAAGLLLKPIHGKSGYEAWLQGLDSDRVLVIVNGEPITPAPAPRWT